MNASTSHNPYAPPQSRVKDVYSEHGVWRDGKIVVLPRHSTLPSRCFKCNAAAETGRRNKRLYYYGWGTTVLVVVLVFVFIPLALILALVLRKSVRVDYSLCQMHRARQRNLLFVTLALVAAAFAVPAMIGFTWGIWIGIGLFLMGLVLAIVRGSGLRAGRIDDDNIRIKGAGRPFLDSLPSAGG